MGVAGFDYTKIANDGADVAADAALGTDPTAWVCSQFARMSAAV